MNEKLYTIKYGQRFANTQKSVKCRRGVELLIQSNFAGRLIGFVLKWPLTRSRLRLAHEIRLKMSSKFTVIFVVIKYWYEM